MCSGVYSGPIVYIQDLTSVFRACSLYSWPMLCIKVCTEILHYVCVQALGFYVHAGGIELCIAVRVQGLQLRGGAILNPIQYLSTLHVHEGSWSSETDESHVPSKPSTHLHVMSISMFKDAFGKKGKLNE